MSNNDEKTSKVVGGIGFLDALFLLFLGLKLCKAINWSWWWVTAPLWGQVLLVLIICLILIIISVLEKIKKG